MIKRLQILNIWSTNDNNTKMKCTTDISYTTISTSQIIFNVSWFHIRGVLLLPIDCLNSLFAFNIVQTNDYRTTTS